VIGRCDKAESVTRSGSRSVTSDWLLADDDVISWTVTPPAAVPATLDAVRVYLPRWVDELTEMMIRLTWTTSPRFTCAHTITHCCLFWPSVNKYNSKELNKQRNKLSVIIRVGTTLSGNKIELKPSTSTERLLLYYYTYLELSKFKSMWLFF